MNRWFSPAVNRGVGNPLSGRMFFFPSQHLPPFLTKISQTWEVSWIAKLKNLEIQAMFYRTFKKCWMWTHVYIIYSKNHPKLYCHTFFALPFKRLRDSGDGFSRFGNRPRKAVCKGRFLSMKSAKKNAEAPQGKEFHVGLTTNGRLFQSKNLFYHNSTNGFNVGPSTWILQRYPGFKIAQRASWKPAETTSSSSSCLTVSKKNTARIDTTQIDCFRRPFCWRDQQVVNDTPYEFLKSRGSNFFTWRPGPNSLRLVPNP